MKSLTMPRLMEYHKIKLEAGETFTSRDMAEHFGCSTDTAKGAIYRMHTTGKVVDVGKVVMNGITYISYKPIDEGAHVALAQFFGYPLKLDKFKSLCFGRKVLFE